MRQRTLHGRFAATLVAMASTSCAGISDPDGGDGGATEEWAAAEVHPCQEQAVAEDFWNCGECGLVCNATDADRCEAGQCRCGPSAACSDGTDCRGGMCVPSDPEGAVCEFDGQCPAGYGCIEGHCSFISCAPEDCDGLDNDCDGAIDEDDGDGPLSQWCFSGTEAQAVHGPCQQGVRSCVGGHWTECMGEVAPIQELGLLRCDGVDNDCDQCVDGTFSGGVCVTREPTAYDVVYMIDVSGSMQGTIDAVKDATRRFSSSFSNRPEFRFGIVQIPGPSDKADRPAVHTDLTDFDSFDAALSTVNADGDFGLEPQYDAVYEAGTGELDLTWSRDSVRIMIVFSDEEAQSYRSLHGLTAVTEPIMCDALTHGEVLAVVTDQSYFDAYDECARTIEMTDADEMEQRLTEIISDPCS